MSNDEVECLICHTKFSTLVYHLQEHEIDSLVYREMFPGAEIRCKSVRERIAASTRKTCQSTEFVQRMSEIKKQNYANDPTLARRVSEGLRKTYQESPELGQRISDSLKAYYQIHEVSDETRQLISENVLRAYQETDLAQRHSESLMGHKDFTTAAGVQLMAEAITKLWRNDEYRSHVHEGWGKHPNRDEERLWNILQRNFPGEWQDNTNGEVVIGNYKPDFINVRDKRVVIEMFGLYWHAMEGEVEKRIDYFKQRGYNCLIFWDTEVWLNETEIIQQVSAL